MFTSFHPFVLWCHVKGIALTKLQELVVEKSLELEGGDECFGPRFVTCEQYTLVRLFILQVTHMVV